MVKLDNITTGCSDLFISDRGFLLLDFLTTTPAETHSARRACKWSGSVARCPKDLQRARGRLASRLRGRNAGVRAWGPRGRSRRPARIARAPAAVLRRCPQI